MNEQIIISFAMGYIVGGIFMFFIMYLINKEKEKKQ